MLFAQSWQPLTWGIMPEMPRLSSAAGGKICGLLFEVRQEVFAIIFQGSLKNFSPALVGEGCLLNPGFVKSSVGPVG